MGKRLYPGTRLFFTLLILNLAPKYKASTASRYLQQSEADVLNLMVNRLLVDTERNTDRNFTTDSCSDQRIKCYCPTNSTHCYVSEINLSSKRLKGKIPPEISKLTSLEYLDLSNSELHGSIPDSMQNLSRLKGLVLDQNNLEGPIPAFLGEMESLTYLLLHDNFFNGSIPAELGNMSSLLGLDLSVNELSGKVPDELGNIQNLAYIYLYENRLTEFLPGGLGNLTNLNYLYVSQNEFKGEIPSSFKGLKSLTSFDVTGNKLSGPLPDFIKNWTQLLFLFLMGNNFQGPLPNGISNLTRLSQLLVADLTSAGGVGREGFSFPDLKNNTNLHSLTLRNCSIKDRIPDYIGKLNLSYLDLTFNQLTGEIPKFNHPKSLISIMLNSKHQCKMFLSAKVSIASPCNSSVAVFLLHTFQPWCIL